LVSSCQEVFCPVLGIEEEDRTHPLKFEESLKAIFGIKARPPASRHVII
jgi:hypothetical protein